MHRRAFFVLALILSIMTSPLLAADRWTIDDLIQIETAKAKPGGRRARSALRLAPRPQKARGHLQGGGVAVGASADRGTKAVDPPLAAARYTGLWVVEGESQAFPMRAASAMNLTSRQNWSGKPAKGPT